MSQTFTSFAEFKRRYPIRPNDDGAMLGSGSYGRVIRVEDQVDTEWVAVKISEFKGNDTKSLRAEVELAQRVPRHSNIARYDACHRLETDTSVSDFAIMKYYPDGNLADLLRRATLTPAQIYDITKGILSGLKHLHQHHIVHRDFKPANILISRDSSGCFIPKIADFGLSKLVSDDELDGSDFDLSDGRGTPSYKAPEQIEGSRVSFNLDLWAFGVILFEIMTGEKPFRVDQRNTSEQSARREIEKKIVTVDLPAGIDLIADPYQRIIRRCLVRDIRERVRKEDELLDLLDRISESLTAAQTLFDRGQYDEALGVYEQVLAKRPGQVDAQSGTEQCKTAIEKQWIAVLLREAESLLNGEQLKQAEQRFDEVLRLSPANRSAIDGKARCISQLQPGKPAAAEQTDAYEPAQTDAYIDPPAPIQPASLPEPPAEVKAIRPDSGKVKPPEPVRIPARPIEVTPATVSPTRTFPWRIAAPAAIVLVASTVFYTIQNGPKAETIKKPQIDTTAIIPIPDKEITGNGKDIAKIVAPINVVVDTKTVMNERVDMALNKARQAFGQKDYVLTLTLTNSALLLDPSRRDVSLLRRAAIDARDKTGVTSGTVPTSVPSPEPVAVAVVKTEILKADPPKPAEPDPKEVAEAARKDAQQKYDQLIEDGIKAISAGNNKAKAIAAFREADALTKHHDLNTSKADNAYAYALKKGDGYYERATYDGAKDWYLVAQTVKNTKEVQKQIRLCTNQIQ